MGQAALGPARMPNLAFSGGLVGMHAYVASIMLELLVQPSRHYNLDACKCVHSHSGAPEPDLRLACQFQVCKRGMQT